jgi:hypothetical protein
MQNCLKPFSLAYLGVIVVTFLLVCNIDHNLQAAEASASPKAILGVDEFMKNVDRHRGKVNLEGVVGTIVPGEQEITLMDRGKFLVCSCVQVILLPVTWRGPMPAMGDLIRIEGQAQEVKGKIMFVADKLEKVGHP